MNQPLLPPQLLGQVLPEEVITILRGSVQLRINDIIRLEAERNYTRFILANGRQILTCRNLSRKIRAGTQKPPAQLLLHH